MHRKVHKARIRRDILLPPPFEIYSGVVEFEVINIDGFMATCVYTRHGHKSSVAIPIEYLLFHMGYLRYEW